MSGAGKDLEVFLAQYDETDWLRAIDELLPCIHEVDRDAVQIWFRFYPLSLRRYLDVAEDGDAARHGLALQGDFDLAKHIDTSHHFLYGHRFWPTVKRKIAKFIAEPTASGGKNSDESPVTTDNGSCSTANVAADGSALVDAIKTIACASARKLNVERSLVNAIAAVGLATLNQVGLRAFLSTPGENAKPVGPMAKSPDAIVAHRAKDDSQGLFGLLKTVDKQFSIEFSATNFSGRFTVMNDQQITHASAKNLSKNWQSMDERCWEGPVPIECTAASCGTCWIGVVGGKEKLSEISRRERRAMKVFGYNQPDDEKPFLRLACQSKAYGNATIIIPPWNGVFGKKVYGNVDEIELEPVTTSAQALRRAVASVVSTEISPKSD